MEPQTLDLSSKNPDQKNQRAKKNTLPTILVLIFVVLLVWTRYDAWKLNADVAEIEISTEQRLAAMERSVSDELAKMRESNDALVEILDTERAENDSLEEQIEDRISKINSTVGSLDKLSKLDPELLQKYSKTYFLNEHFEPKGLSKLDIDMVYNDRSIEFLTKAKPFLEDLIEAAKKDNIDLRVLSGYRSYDTQSALKTSYKVTYGAGANQFSADQGYSEHQLGTAVDFTTSQLGANFESIGNTDAFIWLKNNAHKYGFVLSYPEGNKYYVYEPWHWRFVGIDLAEKLYRKKDNFYDMDQRDIDKYLIVIFDN